MRNLFFVFCLGLSQVAQAEPPKVVTDIAPIHALASRVMQGVDAPALLLPAQSSPHSHALRPSQAADLAAADLLIWTSASLTPWLVPATQALAPDAQQLELMRAPQTLVLPMREETLFEGDGHHDHHGHAHDPDGIDPHGWLNPDNAAIWLGLIATALAKADPENAATYRANADAGQQAMLELAEEFTKRLTPIRQARFAVAHDAFQYLEARFELDVMGAVAASDATAPGAARLVTLRNAMGEHGVNCLLSEPVGNQALIDTVSEGLGVSVAEIDLLGYPGAGGYEAMMRLLADTLVDCAGP